MARPQKCRCICSIPRNSEFHPHNCPTADSINLTYDEYETIRLLDFEHQTQEQCAKKMNISRPTVTRIYNEARQKLADMLVNGKHLTIGGGDVVVCAHIRPECANEPHCCHRERMT